MTQPPNPSSGKSAIVELRDWLQTPPGQYLLGWAQQCLDAAVADVFGFYALQLGLPEIDALRLNRMPQRWRVVDHPQRLQDASRSAALYAAFDALPLPASSVDLVVMPHALELSSDPHRTLREVERVLRPEGRVIILGLNPASLWGLRQQLGHGRQRLHIRRGAALFLPEGGEFIAPWRLQDWLRLLSFQVESTQFGCYKPPLRSQHWLARWEWLERAGPRGWSALGAVYVMTAVKRVHGMRLIGLAPSSAAAGSSVPAAALHPAPPTLPGP